MVGSNRMSTNDQEIAALEQQIMQLNAELAELRKTAPTMPVPGYSFATVNGDVSLAELFGSKDKLLVIHNMGQGCRYCTLWADGFNGIVPHLESVMSVVLVSRDDPATQLEFARSRGWQFRLASHGGGDYIRDQTVMPGSENMPGAVLYEKHDGEVRRKNACVFGPGDIYCSMWSLLGLAGLRADDWTPQYRYWLRPAVLDDGGDNLLG